MLNAIDRMLRWKSFCLLLLLCVFIVTRSEATTDEKAWRSLLGTIEAVIGDNGILLAQDTDERISRIVDFHADFTENIAGRPVSSARRAAVKRGVGLFIRTCQDRYSQNPRQALLTALRDITANRDIFYQLFSSDLSDEDVVQELLAYLTRNENMAYKEPIPIARQVSVPQSATPIQIIEERIRLISDHGTSGQFNHAIDAGETITINIPLRNVSPDPYRSTSGFLQSDDRHIRIAQSEVLYSDRRVIDGRTVTFAPGSDISPAQSYTFTILPNTPDGHIANMELLVWDTDRGKITVPFSVMIYNVGPLDFGNAKIDDDRPGLSEGNDNGIIEPGETIEYVLSLQNRGVVPIESISAELVFDQSFVEPMKGYNVLNYQQISPQNEEPVPASFVFTVKEDIETPLPPQFGAQLLCHGTARGHKYSWLRARALFLGVSDERWEHMLASAERLLSDGKHAAAVEVLDQDRYRYRVEQSERAKQIIAKANANLNAANIAARRERDAELERRRQQAEQQRIKQEADTLRNTPIIVETLPFNRSSAAFDARPGWSKDYSWKFTDRHGREHDIAVRVTTKRYNWTQSCPIWRLTVNGQSIEQDAQGYGHWGFQAKWRLDPVGMTINGTGFKIYRTDYGIPDVEYLPTANDSRWR